MPRPQTPLSHLKARGGYRADRHADREGAPVATGEPIRPDHLADEAGAFWDSVVPELVVCGIVGALDAPVLTAMAQQWGLYRAAVALLAADPTSKPARLAATAYLGMWERLASKCGLTPADRQRLRVESSPQPSEFDTFMGVGEFARDRDKSRFFDRGPT